MIAVSVNGRYVAVPEGFEKALSVYASANYRLGALKKKDRYTGAETELRKEDRAAWTEIYDQLGAMLTAFEDDIKRKQQNV